MGLFKKEVSLNEYLTAQVNEASDKANDAEDSIPGLTSAIARAEGTVESERRKVIALFDATRILEDGGVL